MPGAMQFRLDGSFLQRLPDASVTLVVAEQVDSARGGDAIGALLDAAIHAARASYGTVDAIEREVGGWNRALDRLGVDHRLHPPSIANLLHRVLRDEAPRIGPIVDLANALSLRFRVPIGAHDIDRLRGSLAVRLADGDEYFTALGETSVDRVSPGEPVYADDREVRTRWWIGRQGDRGKVTVASRSIAFPIDAIDEESAARAGEAAAELARILEAHGARTRTLRVDRRGPVVEMGVEPRPRDAIDRFLDRGLVELYPSRAEVEKRLRSGERLTVYQGVDPTSPIIHIGHAVGIRKLRELQDLGHRVILLIGDFTGRIGDPTGKDAARVPLTHEQVLENARTYREQAARILRFDGPDPVEMRFNGEWWDPMTARDMIGLAAQFTVQQMIQRDMFQRRLAEHKPIGLHEFLYPLLQGYDSIALQVDAELGGTDQTFNMLAGRSLVRAIQDRDKIVFVTGLLPGTDGRKMSKSAGNVIGVAEEPSAMYGQIMSIADSLLLTYYEMCSGLDDDALDEVRHAMANGVNPMVFKKRLARTIVASYHGDAAADAAEKRFEREVQGREAPEEMPTARLDREEWTVTDLLLATGLAPSKGEARRLIEGGAVRLDDEPIRDRNRVVRVATGTVLRAGRRSYCRIDLT